MTDFEEAFSREDARDGIHATGESIQIIDTNDTHDKVAVVEDGMESSGSEHDFHSEGWLVDIHQDDLPAHADLDEYLATITIVLTSRDGREVHPQNWRHTGQGVLQLSCPP